MASPELQRLWKLAQIDNRLTDIRKRAAALDPGRSIVAEIQRLEEEDATVGGQYRTLHAEQRDLELQQASLDDKYKRIEKELYGGKVVSVREVETLEKEKASINRQKDRNDERLIELLDLVPPAQKAAEAIAEKIADAKKRLAVRKKAALEEKTTLETEFARLTAARPEATRGIAPALMTRYDSARQRAGGVGMVQVSKTFSCGGCGTMVPERAVQGLKDEKIVTCESCHRILYYTTGLI